MPYQNRNPPALPERIVSDGPLSLPHYNYSRLLGYARCSFYQSFNIEGKVQQNTIIKTTMIMGDSGMLVQRRIAPLSGALVRAEEST